MARRGAYRTRASSLHKMLPTTIAPRQFARRRASTPTSRPLRARGCTLLCHGGYRQRRHATAHPAGAAALRRICSARAEHRARVRMPLPARQGEDGGQRQRTHSLARTRVHTRHRHAPVGRASGEGAAAVCGRAMLSIMPCSPAVSARNKGDTSCCGGCCFKALPTDSVLRRLALPASPCVGETGGTSDVGSLAGLEGSLADEPPASACPAAIRPFIPAPLPTCPSSSTLRARDPLSPPSPLSSRAAAASHIPDTV